VNVPKSLSSVTAMLQASAGRRRRDRVPFGYAIRSVSETQAASEAGWARLVSRVQNRADA